MTAPTGPLGEASRGGCVKTSVGDKTRRPVKEHRQTDANVEWMEQSGWMLNPILSQPQAHTARAEETCPPQATDVFKRRKTLTGVSSSHAVVGARPYCSPEYSLDFYKSGSALRPSTCGTMWRVKAGNSTPLQHSTKTRVPYMEKKRLLDRQEEIQEVKQLDEWKPAVDIFAAVLEGLDDKAS